MASIDPQTGLQYKDATDIVFPASAWLNALTDTIKVWMLNRLGQYYVWPTVASTPNRTTQTGMGEGSKGYEQDTKKEWLYTGGTWILWSQPRTSFTPTITNFSSASTAPAVTGYYWVAAGICHVYVQAKLGTGTITVGNVSLALPIAMVAAVSSTMITESTHMLAAIGMTDVSVSASYAGILRFVDASDAKVRTQGTLGLTAPLSSTNPFTWATLDELSFYLEYPVS